MAIPTLQLSDYVAPGEACHLARVALQPGRRPALHTHDFFELFWVDYGQVRHLTDEGSREDLLSTGALVFVRPHDVHGLQAHRGRAGLINIAFGREPLDAAYARHADRLGEQTFWSGEPNPATLSLGPLQQRTLNAWAHRLDAAGRSSLALDAFLLAVLGLLLHDETLPEGVENGPAWLSDACRTLRRPERLRQGVRGFVETTGCNSSHVSRVCRQFTGKPPSALVREARMELAGRLLATTDQPILDVAAEVGLENLSHFYAQFRRHYGQTPRAYRQQRARSIVAVPA